LVIDEKANKLWLDDYSCHAVLAARNYIFKTKLARRLKTEILASQTLYLTSKWGKGLVQLAYTTRLLKTVLDFLGQLT